MSKDNEVINGKREMIPTVFGKTYFFVSQNDIMLTIAEENKHQQRDLRVTTETICRLVSKGLKARLSMEEVIEQMRKSDGGRGTIVAELADRMEKYLQCELE